MELKELYGQSIIKWENILEYFEEFKDYCTCGDFYMDYCLNPCAFCHEYYICKNCLINKDICGYNGKIVTGLLRRGSYIIDREEFRGWILEMINALKVEYEKL